MKKWLVWLVGTILTVALLWSGERTISQARVVEVPVGTLSLEEVHLLKEYHGARAVKFENGNWYFLGPRGRRWYPLTTLMACRELELSCVETAAK